MKKMEKEREGRYGGGGGDNSDGPSGRGESARGDGQHTPYPDTLMELNT